MRFVIFGTGKMYQENKLNIRKDAEIVAFIDNMPDKWGQEIDGIKVYAPEELNHLDYDVIFIMSIHWLDMQQQLRSMGIPKDKIYTLDNHIEILCERENVQYYGKISVETSGGKVLVFSHAMTSTGAQNVLFYAVDAMKRMGYQIVIVSKSDGVLRERLVGIGIPVVIIRDIYSRRAEIEHLIMWADVLFVNTLLLYDTVMEVSNYNKKLIWWIHETGIIKYLEDFRYIVSKEYVSVYVVSPLVKRLLQQAFGEDLRLKEMIYGLPYYEITKRTEKEKMIFAIIGWIDYTKGQDIFLDAVDRLPAYIRRKTEFWIVGAGKFARDEMEIIKKYSCIKLVGEVENAQMSEIYKNIDVVVCASRAEAMSVAVTEGCMTEKLVIVSNAAGITEFIKHKETGLIFESGNANELAAWIEWAVVHREEAEKIGIASKVIYENNFSMELFEKNIVEAVQQ